MVGGDWLSASIANPAIAIAGFTGGKGVQNIWEWESLSFSNRKGRSNEPISSTPNLHIFRGIFKFLLPVAKSVGKTVGKQALSAGSNIAADLLQGQSFQDSLKTHGGKAIKRTVKQLAGNQTAKKKPQKAVRRVQKGRGVGSRKRSKAKARGKNSTLTLGVVKSGKKKGDFFNWRWRDWWTVNQDLLREVSWRYLKCPQHSLELLLRNGMKYPWKTL